MRVTVTGNNSGVAKSLTNIQRSKRGTTLDRLTYDRPFSERSRLVYTDGCWGGEGDGRPASGVTREVLGPV